MRHTIWKRDDFFLIGGERIDMDPAVVELPEETPLVWNFDFSKGIPMGKVTDIKLEDGEITGEVEFFDPAYDDVYKLDEFNCRLGGYYLSVEKTEDGKNITKCRLQAVSVVLNSGMPRLPKEVSDGKCS